MDEAGRIGIPNLPEHASTVNGRNISLSMSAQSGLSLRPSMAGTGQKTSLPISGRSWCFVRLILTPPSTIQTGWGTPQAIAHSESEHEGQTSSTGKSERGIPVMSPQDFEEMDDGELVCFIGKKKRFRLKSMDWRRHPALLKRLGMKPPDTHAVATACREPTGTRPSAKTATFTRLAL